MHRSVEDAARHYYLTVDTANPDDVVALFADTAVYRRPGYPEMVGVDALRHFYAAARVIDSGKHTITTLVVDRDRVAVSGSFRGLLRDGSAVEVGFADFFRFERGLIAERSTFFDAPAV